jgi:hypothetical protein
MLNLYELHQQLESLGILFSFSGPVSQDVIEGIGEAIKQKMELEEAGVNVIQRVFSVFVEQMQNIVNYSAEAHSPNDQLDGELRSGVLLLGLDGGQFFIQCGNKIAQEQVPVIEAKLKALSAMDKDQLKALYLERRKAARNDSRKGGSLGFIDMARKASKPLEYVFIPIDESYAFFSIKTVVGEN